MKTEFNLIKRAIPRQDARTKVTGQAMFADDYRLPGQLFGVMVRLPVAHARIHRIDYSAIHSDPAIVAICDSNDIPGAKKVGVVKADQPIFAFEKIVTPGDVVAMLLGESEEKLFPLRDKVRVDYEPLPGLTDP
ncbi:MAG: xanthine dehydrogenase, partial [candidate division KSB1 bacterium]|nr:xanthine dehydrogenase [candidate division KSB1 bacterium]